MWCELWDSESGNRVGKYPTEEAALRAVLEDIRLYGHDAEVIVSLALLQRDPDRQQDRLIAEGTMLVERALAVAGRDTANGVTTTTDRVERPNR